MGRSHHIAICHGKRVTGQQVLAFIRESPTPVGKREIARAFQLKGSDRIPLKALLKELEHEGQVDRGRNRRMGAAGELPEVTVVQIIGPDADGDLWARPVDLRPDDAEPKILVIEQKRGDRHEHKPPHAPLGPGDRVLVEFARLLTSCVREGEICARWGGEEFLVLLPGVGLEQAVGVARRLRDVLRERPVSVGELALSLSASSGVSEHRAGESYSETVQRADTALYEAKQEGRDRISYR